uniref:COX assembly mitochondrial protein n=1 Tax=Romanomermis culicivorax TaxID=13658 RepID=A0A915HMW3_ROMCU
MVISFDVELPPPDQIRIPQELEVTAPALRAGSIHLGKYCEFECKELTLCRQEMKDPRKCLKEGAETTACAVNFFQKVKKHCRDEFNRYAHCVEFGSTVLGLYTCRKPQRLFDKCMLEKLDLDRPPLGYYSRPKIHESARPVPPPQFQRDYYAEANQMIDELPDDYPIHKEYKRYYRGHIQPWMA